MPVLGHRGRMDMSTGIRFYFQAGSGPNGGRGGCKTTAGEESVTTALTWYVALISVHSISHKTLFDAVSRASPPALNQIKSDSPAFHNTS